MISEDIEALTLADVAGALDAEERQDLLSRISALAPDEREHVARLYDVTRTLAAAAAHVPPRPGVRDALMARIAAPANYTVLAREGTWIDPGVPGLRVKILALDRERDLVTLLLIAQPGARYPAHRHSMPEECYVLRGSVVIEGRVLHAGDFHHADADSDHGEISTVDGAEVLLVGSAADYHVS
jgi:anti-sigma factor ChrR (cupin superfamily)